LAGRLGSLPAMALTALLVTGAAAIDYGGGRSLTAPLDEAASGRVTAWTEGLEMLKSRPLLGVGFGQFSDYHELTAHNSFVLCFAETGTLGYFFWMGLLIVTFVELRSVTRLEGDDSGHHDLRHVAYALELSLCGFVTAAFFLSRTFIPMLY